MRDLRESAYAGRGMPLLREREERQTLATPYHWRGCSVCANAFHRLRGLLQKKEPRPRRRK